MAKTGLPGEASLDGGVSGTVPLSIGRRNENKDNMLLMVNRLMNEFPNSLSNNILERYHPYFNHNVNLKAFFSLPIHFRFHSLLI